MYGLICEAKRDGKGSRLQLCGAHKHTSNILTACTHCAHSYVPYSMLSAILIALHTRLTSGFDERYYYLSSIENSIDRA